MRLGLTGLTGVMGLSLLLSVTSVAEEPELARCREQMQRVRDALERRDDLRDEAYTAIMWRRLDAEAALGAGDAQTCLAKLDFPRRALGIHEDSSPR